MFDANMNVGNLLYFHLFCHHHHSLCIVFMFAPNSWHLNCASRNGMDASALTVQHIHIFISNDAHRRLVKIMIRNPIYFLEFSDNTPRTPLSFTHTYKHLLTQILNLWIYHEIPNPPKVNQIHIFPFHAVFSNHLTLEKVIKKGNDEARNRKKKMAKII